MTIRAYLTSDFPTVEAWARARDMQIIPQLLSPNGFLVEDDDGPLMVCWIYLVFDCPIAIIDNLFSRPNSSAKKSLAAWTVIWRAVQRFIADLRDCKGEPMNYNLIRTFSRPEISKFLERDGWQVSEQTYKQAIFIRHG